MRPPEVDDNLYHERSSEMLISAFLTFSCFVSRLLFVKMKLGSKTYARVVKPPENLPKGCQTSRKRPQCHIFGRITSQPPPIWIV